METKMKVALLGLGTMGSGMAQNLLKADFPLTVYNRTRAKAEALEAAGGGGDGLRDSMQAQSHLGNDAERALGANHQPGKVVPRR